MKRFKDICRMMIRNHFNFNWFSYFRCTNTDEEVFDLMLESGCKGVHLGIESGDQEILNNMKKDVDLDSYRNGISELNQREIISLASFIIGFPGETEESISNTIKFINENPLTWYQAELFYYDPSTIIHREAQKYSLTGKAYNWKHETMDWSEACDHVENVVNKVERAVLVPETDFGLWSVPYLLGKGLSLEQILGFAKMSGSLIVDGIGKEFLDCQEYEENVVELFSSLK